jgi:hypothetical protein
MMCLRGYTRMGQLYRADRPASLVPSIHSATARGAGMSALYSDGFIRKVKYGRCKTVHTPLL